MPYRTARRLSLALVLLLAAPLAAAESPAADDTETLYALGLALAQRLANAGFTEADVVHIQEGLADGILGREARVDLQTYGPRIEALLSRKQAVAAQDEKQAGTAFREQAARAEGVERTDSGLIYEVIETGSGDSPDRDDTVKLEYTGTLRDGTMFDRSETGKPVTFPLNGVIPCFSEGISKMRVGGTSKLVCPPEIAYGDRGFPPVIPPGATLIFQIKLLEIVNEGEGATGGSR